MNDSIIVEFTYSENVVGTSCWICEDPFLDTKLKVYVLTLNKKGASKTYIVHALCIILFTYVLQNLKDAPEITVQNENQDRLESIIN